jgi:hypothetical protein
VSGRQREAELEHELRPFGQLDFALLLQLEVAERSDGARAAVGQRHLAGDMDRLSRPQAPEIRQTIAARQQERLRDAGRGFA